MWPVEWHGVRRHGVDAEPCHPGLVAQFYDVSLSGQGEPGPAGATGWIESRPNGPGAVFALAGAPLQRSASLHHAQVG